MKYRVNWRYQSGLGGPWQAGDFIDLDEALADRINVDSPGVLSSEGELATLPEADRMIKAPGRKRHTVAREGEITSDDWGARRKKEDKQS